MDSVWWRWENLRKQISTDQGLVLIPLIDLQYQSMISSKSYFWKDFLWKWIEKCYLRFVRSMEKLRFWQSDLDIRMGNSTQLGRLLFNTPLSKKLNQLWDHCSSIKIWETWLKLTILMLIRILRGFFKLIIINSI
jgi:hypothetical protein